MSLGVGKSAKPQQTISICKQSAKPNVLLANVWILRLQSVWRVGWGAGKANPQQMRPHVLQPAICLCRFLQTGASEHLEGGLGWGESISKHPRFKATGGQNGVLRGQIQETNNAQLSAVLQLGSSPSPICPGTHLQNHCKHLQTAGICKQSAKHLQRFFKICVLQSGPILQIELARDLLLWRGLNFVMRGS